MFKRIIKINVIIGLTLLSMANQRCQNLPGVGGRQLKKNVRILGVQTSSFLDNSQFNFSETAQAQISGVLFEDNYFFERNNYSRPVDMENTPQIGNVKLSSVAVNQIKQWLPNTNLSTMSLSSKSSCLVTRPQHLLAARINSLEASGGGKLQFGFSQLGFQLPVSAKFNLDQMKLDLSFYAIDPWTGQTMASVNTKATKSDYSVGFGVDLGNIHIGPEFYKITGLAETVMKGLRNGLSDLGNKLLSVPRQEWQTRVLVARDQAVIIIGGAELGLKKGDLLKVENELHDWIGAPCGSSSILAGSVVASSEPWIIEIEDAGNLMSKARIVNLEAKQKSGDLIESGALVRVHELIKDAAVSDREPVAQENINEARN